MNTKTCPMCAAEKPLTEFWWRRDREQPASRCKVCSTEANRLWRRRNPEYEKRRYQAERVQTRERHLVRKYGVDLAQYERMLKAQEGRCAICGCEEKTQHNGVFHVDHCHKTGAVRGLLCRGCNHVLGHLKDDPELLRNAISYLASPSVPQIPELIGRAILQAEGMTP